MMQRRPSRWVFVPRQGRAGKKDKRTARAECLLSREKLELREGKTPEELGKLSVMQEPDEQMCPFLSYTCSLLAGDSGVHWGRGLPMASPGVGRTPLSAHPACWPRRGHQKRKRKVLSLLGSHGGIKIKKHISAGTCGVCFFSVCLSVCLSVSLSLSFWYKHTELKS